MNPERYRKVKEVFAVAAGRGPHSRDEFIAAACAGDADLRAEVESLLYHDEAASDFIEDSAFDVAARLMADGDARLLEGRKVGAYKILNEVGRGGMGVVYLAERDDERFRQRVAIKVVKRGLDTDDILRRFRNERQILASLNHPNIARLFDGGETDDGRPYFVMEYVEGVPLLRYCDDDDLSTEERLKLFRTVCSAVQHAHQNLVVHRDIKPSNILVTRAGELKLLDFGVAKLLSAELTGEALTQTAALRIMTPEYASPEQMLGQRVTTATDVYSLGVVLFELLTGARPYRLENDASPLEISSAVCQSEPTKPSEAIAVKRKKLAGTSAAEATRAATPDPRALKGDLDNIILKALKKDPGERYESVEQLSEDLRRHLGGLPVLARGDTFAYHTSKFIRRNKAGVAAASLVALAIIAGLIGTTWQAQRARAQTRLAHEQRDRAQTAQQRAEKINRFMQSIFAYANPQWFGRAGGRRDVSVLEAMRDIENHIDEDFRDEPDLRADVYQQIGDAYRTQGLYRDAERNLRKALSLRLDLYGEDNAKVAESMYILSGARYQLSDYGEWEQLLTKAFGIQRRHPNEGNNLPYMMADYAGLLRDFKNDFAGALPLYSESLQIFRQRHGENHYMIGANQDSMVTTYLFLGDYAQAEPLARECLKRPQLTFPSLAHLAYLQTINADYQAAQESITLMTALAQNREATADLMPRTLYAQSFLAYNRGDYAQALTFAKRAFAILPNEAANYDQALYVGQSLNELGQAKRAEKMLREEIEQLKKTDAVFTLAVIKSALGRSLSAQRRFAEAEPLLLEAHETQRSRVLPREYHLICTRRRLAELYDAWGKHDLAAQFREASGPSTPARILGRAGAVK